MLYIPYGDDAGCWFLVTGFLKGIYLFFIQHQASPPDSPEFVAGCTLNPEP
jgi:hypothetical protein